MNIEINNVVKAELFCNIFQHLKVFNETINIQLLESGLYIQGMDSSHVSIFIVTIPKEWFDVYNGTNWCCLGINTTIFFKILNTRERNQTMRFEYKEDESDTLFIYLTSPHSQNDLVNSTEFDRHFETPLMDITSESLTVPEVDYSAELTLSSAKLYAVASQLKLFGDTAEILCNDKRVAMTSSSHNTGKMVVDIKLEELGEYAIEDEKELKLAFSLNYLYNFCLFYKLAREVKLGFSDDYPMKLFYELGEGATVCFYLAPKMMDDSD